MNIHQNAHLTPQGRALLVSRILDAGWQVAGSWRLLSHRTVSPDPPVKPEDDNRGVTRK